MAMMLRLKAACGRGQYLSSSPTFPIVPGPKRTVTKPGAGLFGASPGLSGNRCQLELCEVKRRVNEQFDLVMPWQSLGRPAAESIAVLAMTVPVKSTSKRIAL
jgi:hypothetical protein